MNALVAMFVFFLLLAFAYASYVRLLLAHTASNPQALAVNISQSMIAIIIVSGVLISWGWAKALLAILIIHLFVEIPWRIFCYNEAASTALEPAEKKKLDNESTPHVAFSLVYLFALALSVAVTAHFIALKPILVVLLLAIYLFNLGKRLLVNWRTAALITSLCLLVAFDLAHWIGFEVNVLAASESQQSALFDGRILFVGLILAMLHIPSDSRRVDRLLVRGGPLILIGVLTSLLVMLIWSRPQMMVPMNTSVSMLVASLPPFLSCALFLMATAIVLSSSPTVNQTQKPNRILLGNALLPMIMLIALVSALASAPDAEQSIANVLGTKQPLLGSLLNVLFVFSGHEPTLATDTPSSLLIFGILLGYLFSVALLRSDYLQAAFKAPARSWLGEFIFITVNARQAASLFAVFVAVFFILYLHGALHLLLLIGLTAWIALCEQMFSRLSRSSRVPAKIRSIYLLFLLAIGLLATIHWFVYEIRQSHWWMVFFIVLIGVNYCISWYRRRSKLRQSLSPTAEKKLFPR